MKDNKTQWNPDKRGGKAAFHRARKKEKTKNRGLIFSLGFGYGLKTQIVKIRKKLFSTRQMAMVSTLIFLAIGAGIYFAYDYAAKGATFGWVQSSWSGGTLTDQTSCENAGGTWDATNSQCLATHTSNQSGWTAYESKDSNVDTTGDQLTLSAGSSQVEDTTTGDFDAGSESGDTLVFDYSGDQLTATAGYDAAGICGDFEVWATDRSSTTTWSTANSYCDNLCTNCDLPTKNELQCICNNKTSLGNNYRADAYWSSTPSGSGAYLVFFSDCSALTLNTSYALYVRCVHRY